MEDLGGAVLGLRVLHKGGTQKQCGGENSVQEKRAGIFIILMIKH